MIHIWGFSSLNIFILVDVLRAERYFEHSDVCFGVFCFFGVGEPYTCRFFRVKSSLFVRF